MTVTATRTVTDTRGNPHSGSTEALARYEESIDLLVRFDTDVVDQMSILVTEHPDDAMGRALAAYLHLLGTDVADLDAAREHVAALQRVASDERARGHAEAARRWSAGDWHGAARSLDEVLVQWPTDTLALFVGHQLDFFLGDARGLRDRIGRSLTAYGTDDPHRGFVRGMQAFGLEESGHYHLAEEAALDAVERNADDVWGVHAAAHTYEMQGRVDDGLRFMAPRIVDWGDGNLLAVHSWWHYALYLMEAGRVDDVLGVYDEHVHHDASDMVPIEMLDASSMLWRLHLDRADTGDRAARLADDWLTHQVRPGSWYVFNDAHAVMALVQAGRLDDAEVIVADLERYGDAASQREASNARMTVEVGVPVCRALIAFGQERYDETVEELGTVRRRLHTFGGSHAQRDVFERTLLEAAVRASRTELADRLLSERLALRPTGVFALDRSARLARTQDDADLERVASRAAEGARARFAAAV
jgi:tetratricopeptide (TPR) repeat protein